MLLQVKNLRKAYGKTVAVNDVSFSLEKGELFSLLGPSGCGKSTMLRMIAGFEKPDQGSIVLDGVDITALPPYKRDINTVFQNYALFPNMNVRKNVAYGLRVKRTPESEVGKRVQEALEMVGLEDFGDRMPSQLSGGQQQRVALARALINRPALLLLDEPMSALDKKIAEQTRAELVALQKQVGISFVFVTHNQTEALAMSHRVAVMNAGVIEQCDSPRAIYELPLSRFVAGFIGSMNFFEGVISNSDSSECSLTLLGDAAVRLNKPCNFKAGEEIQFLLRPEQLKLTVLDPQPYENCLPGTIRGSVYLGDMIVHQIELASGRTISVQVQNYLSAMSEGFYENGEPINIVWSKSSGSLIRAH